MRGDLLVKVLRERPTPLLLLGLELLEWMKAMNKQNWEYRLRLNGAETAKKEGKYVI